MRGKDVSAAPKPAPAAGADNGAVDWAPTAAAAPPDGDFTARPLLDGVHIVDMGAYYAGPYSSRLLGDLGADVIKLETLGGDQVRGLERVFRSASANKRSISANLKDPELEAAKRGLVEWADIIHHNMRPGAAERLGLGRRHVTGKGGKVGRGFGVGDALLVLRTSPRIGQDPPGRTTTGDERESSLGWEQRMRCWAA